MRMLSTFKLKIKAKWAKWTALATVTSLLVVSMVAPPSTAQTPIAQTPIAQMPIAQMPIAQINAGQSADQIDPDQERICAKSYGDPHLVTFDDYRYSFQTVGEYILAQSQDGEVVVQARQAAVPNRDISLNSAAAIKVGEHRVGIYAQDAPDDRSALWVDGEPADLGDEGLIFPEGGSVAVQGDRTYWVNLPTGEQVEVQGINVADTDFLNISVCLPASQRNRMEGLLGNFNGSGEDDLRGRDGQVVPSQDAYAPVTQLVSRAIDIPLPLNDLQTAFFGQLYRQFGDSWRITQAESLFDYGPGESTVTFTNRAFPDRFPSLVGVPANRIRAAQETCQEAGVGEDALEGCVFDVAATGQSGFAQAAANALAEVVVDRVEAEVRDRVRDALPIPRGFPF